MAASIEIKTESGYQHLLAYESGFISEGGVTTAEVIDDPGLPAFAALLQAAHRVEGAQFRIGGREVQCFVHLSGPALEAEKVMFRRVRLSPPQPGA